MTRLTTSSGGLLTIELSPNSRHLSNKAASASANPKDTMTSEELTKYETCLKSRLQNVTAVEKRLTKMVAKELEEQRQAEAKASKERELQEQARLAEQAKAAAAANKQQRPAPTPARAAMHTNTTPDSADDIPSEVNGCITHSCRCVAELLDFAGFGIDDVEKQFSDPVMSASVSHCPLGDDEVDLPNIALHLLRSMPTYVTTRTMGANASDDMKRAFTPQWLVSLIERANSTSKPSAMISMPSNSRSMAEFLFGGNSDDLREIRSMLNPFDHLATSALQWSTHKAFGDPSKRQVLSVIRSLLVQLHKRTSYFCGAYDMLAGRAMVCMQGCRVVAGFPIKSALEHYEVSNGRKVSTISELASWMKTTCSLEQLIDDGFYVVLQEAAVLVVPPAYFLMECSLGMETVVLSYPVMPLPEHYVKGQSPPTADVYTHWLDSASALEQVLSPDQAKAIIGRVEALNELLQIRQVKTQEEEAASNQSAAKNSSNKTSQFEQAISASASNQSKKSLATLYEETMQRLAKLDEAQIKTLVHGALVHPLLPEYEASVFAEDPSITEWHFGEDDGLTDLADFCHFLRARGLNPEALLSMPSGPTPTPQQPHSPPEGLGVQANPSCRGLRITRPNPKPKPNSDTATVEQANHEQLHKQCHNQHLHVPGTVANTHPPSPAKEAAAAADAEAAKVNLQQQSQQPNEPNQLFPTPAVSPEAKTKATEAEAEQTSSISQPCAQSSSPPNQSTTAEAEEDQQPQQLPTFESASVTTAPESGSEVFVTAAAPGTPTAAAPTASHAAGIHPAEVQLQQEQQRQPQQPPSDPEQASAPATALRPAEDTALRTTEVAATATFVTAPSLQPATVTPTDAAPAVSHAAAEIHSAEAQQEQQTQQQQQLQQQQQPSGQELPSTPATALQPAEATAAETKNTTTTTTTTTEADGATATPVTPSVRPPSLQPETGTSTAAMSAASASHAAAATPPAAGIHPAEVQHDQRPQQQPSGSDTPTALQSAAREVHQHLHTSGPGSALPPQPQPESASGTPTPTPTSASPAADTHQQPQGAAQQTTATPQAEEPRENPAEPQPESEPFHIRKQRFFDSKIYSDATNKEKQHQQHAEAMAKAAEMTKFQLQAKAIAAAAAGPAEAPKKRQAWSWW